MEQNSELVSIGKIIHESSYKREKKEIQIGPVKIDFIGSDGVIHEVKKTPSVETAHIWLLKYYLFYLKKQGIKIIRGMINYPRLKKTIDIELSTEDEIMLRDILIDIKKIIEREEVREIIEKRYHVCH